MDFSLWPAMTRSWKEVADLATLGDRRGWFGMWFADHLMLDSGTEEPLEGDCMDAWALMPAVAALTETIRLGPLVAPLTFRHPATLASAAHTLAQISDDRFVLGIGAGWQLNEHATYGVPLGLRRERSDRLEEGCRVVRSLLGDERPTFDGDYFSVQGPVRQPARSVPLLVGGRGEQRTLRTAAMYADEWNAWCDAEQVVQKLSVLVSHCEDVGRDPGEIKCSVNTMLAMHDDPTVAERVSAAARPRPALTGRPGQIIEQIGALRVAGVEEVIIADWNLDDPSERTDVFERFTDEVIAAID